MLLWRAERLPRLPSALELLLPHTNIYTKLWLNHQSADLLPASPMFAVADHHLLPPDEKRNESISRRPKEVRVRLFVHGFVPGSDVIIFLEDTFDFDIGVTSFDCSESIEVKEDVPSAVDVSDAIDGAGEGTAAFLPRLLNDELILIDGIVINSTFYCWLLLCAFSATRTDIKSIY